MTILLFGATGLAGSGVLRACLADAAVTEVRALLRRTTGVQHLKLREVIHYDYLNYLSAADAFSGVDACFFCLGISVRHVPAEADDSRNGTRHPQPHYRERGDTQARRGAPAELTLQQLADRGHRLGVGHDVDVIGAGDLHDARTR